MLIIPAIDLKGGRCVRLRQGRMEDETVFSDDPPAVARAWREAGARRLHVVDLDGAIAGRPVNIEIIRAIARDNPGLPVQIGGGIRDPETAAAYLDAGMRWVILGTLAVSAPQTAADLCRELPGRVIVGLDARDGRAAVDGWSTLSEHTVVELARRFGAAGAAAIVYTDIQRDGMLGGLNVEATADLARQAPVPVIASGGVRDLDDVRRICAVAADGILGAITGRALYEGTLELGAAQALADELAGEPAAGGGP